MVAECVCLTSAFGVGHVFFHTPSFERGDLYRERDIDRAVTIIIEDGESPITVNGEPFAGNGQTGNVGAG